LTFLPLPLPYPLSPIPSTAGATAPTVEAA